jgi:membrane protein implicated in regulation of membrane protease activity
MFGFELHAGWWWAIGGAILLILEVLAPGFFLMFVGGAAILTGLVTIALDLPLAGSLVLFVIASALAVMLGKRYYGEKGLTDDVGMLNDAAKRLAGRTATVVDPVDAHGGRVKLGDSEWTARGGPAAAGERVTIVDVDGNCLIVENRPA